MKNFFKIRYVHLPKIILSHRKTFLSLLLLIFAYITGFTAGYIRTLFQPESQPLSGSFAVPASTEGSWGLSFQEEGQPPVGNADPKELSAYNSYYVRDTDKKEIYLTFDCGYENGNTSLILDTLKKHAVPATFFVVGTFIQEEPGLILRMTEEGHTVGNHTWHHPDMSQISDINSFQKELEDVENAFSEVTGKELSRFYRPPKGIYNLSNLQMAKKLGYTTFFWSLAYVDWLENDQPSENEAFDKLLGRIHPGAIVLLHNTSDTNAAILDRLLTKWEEMGYRIRPLDDFLS